MRYEGIYVTGLGVRLGQQVRTTSLVTRGALAAVDARRARQRSVCVATESGPALAAAVARQAMRSHRHSIGTWLSVRVHPHESVYDKPDLWCAACSALGMGLGPELAASLFVGRIDLRTAMVAGGDRFDGEGLQVRHLGAADHVVALRHLSATSSVEPGDYVVVASAGAGMTRTTAFIQIQQPVHGPCLHSRSRSGRQVNREL